MAKKKGKEKKGKTKAPKKPPHLTVLEYLLESGLQKKLRLTEHSDWWREDNEYLQTQVNTLRSEQETTITYLRRTEADERRRCEEIIAERDQELSDVETLLRTEQADYDRQISELCEHLRKTMEHLADLQDQVSFWKNYPFIQKVEKQEKIKYLKTEIRHIDELYSNFEEQLDGNFHYMRSHLIRTHAQRRERCKQKAAGRALQQVTLSDHSDLSAQDALCVQTVLNTQHADRIRNQLDKLVEKNAELQRALVPLRCLYPPPELPGSDSSSGCSSAGGAAGGGLRLHLDSLTRLLSSPPPDEADQALVARLRDATLESIRPDEDELRARALAARARPPADSDADSAGSAAASPAGSELSDGREALLPFEARLRPAPQVRRQAMAAFEPVARRRRWWRVHHPTVKPRTWPVTGPQLALYAEEPPVFDLAGPKVICESPSESSTHLSDEWQQGKLGWQEYLQRRSALSLTPAGSGEAVAAGEDRAAPAGGPNPSQRALTAAGEPAAAPQQPDASTPQPVSEG